jgi:hypothetical protein
MGDTDGNGDVNIIDLLIVIELGPLLVIPHHPTAPLSIHWGFVHLHRAVGRMPPQLDVSAMPMLTEVLCKRIRIAGILSLDDT